MSFLFAGNDRVKTSVQLLIKEKRIPHAIIISGDAGTGKRTLARYIAGAAVCQGDTPPCSVCKSCKLFASGNHPDVFTVAPADNKKNITVAQIREVREKAFIKSHMGSKKVFIINQAELMNEQSQNALLKILEEPPRDVCFILTVQNPTALLDTVVSRCVVFSLTAPDFAQAEEYLSETTEYSLENIRLAVSECEGNIGKCLDFLSGNSENLRAQAVSFAALLSENADVYTMLKFLCPFEKNRTECETFIKQLREVIAEKIIDSRENTYICKQFMRYLKILDGVLPSLNTNINLSLFLSTVVSAFKSNF